MKKYETASFKGILGAGALFLLGLLLSGCFFYSPKDDAFMRANALEKKGYIDEADKLRWDAETLPEESWSITPQKDPTQSDPYHFPELQKPESERNYDIKISTFRAIDY